MMQATRALAPVPNSTYMAAVWKNALAFSPIAARSGINTGEQNGAAYGSLDFLINAFGPGAAGHLGLGEVLEKGKETTAAAGGLPVLAGQLLTHSAAQGGAMVATELTNALHEYVTGVDPDALRSDRLVPRLAQAGAMGGLLSAAFQLPGITGELTARRQMAANAAMREADGDASLVEAYQASGAMQLSEPRARDALRSMIPENQRMRYLQAEDINEVAGKVGMTPEDLAAAMNASDEYKQALATGKVMHVKTEDLIVAAAKLKDPAKITAVIAARRSQPNGTNVNESLQFFKEAPEEIAGLHASLQADITNAAKSIKEDDPIYRDVLEQVSSAGRPEQEARDDARLMAARFNTLAKRWNEAEGGAAARGARVMDPLEEYQKFKLKIQQFRPGAHPVDITDAMIERLKSGDIPSPTKAYGESLLDHLRKRGVKDDMGELSVMDVDKDLKPGQQKLIDPGGYQLDTAAARAHEFGYLSEPSVPELMEKMREELAGRPVYAEGAGDPVHAYARELLTEMQETLAKKGIGLHQSNAEIKAALAGAAGPAMHRFEQAMHGPPLEVNGKRVVAADVPYGGGSSKDGNTIYIDRRIPRYGVIDGKRVDIWKLIADHEDLEKRLLDQGMTYAQAHAEATKGEDHIADHQGIKHADYENFLKPFLERAKREARPDQVPADIEDRPYQEMGGANLIEGRSTRYEQAIGRIQPNGESLAMEDLLKQYRRANGDRTPVQGSAEWMRLQREASRIDQERGLSFAQAEEGQARGALEFNAERHFLVTLSGNANLSTVAHEFAHFWFETMGDYANEAGAPKQLKDDYAKLLEFSGYGTHEPRGDAGRAAHADREVLPGGPDGSGAGPAQGSHGTA